MFATPILLRRILPVLTLVPALFIGLTGCSDSVGAESHQERPKSLTLAVSINEETVERRVRLEGLRDHLSEKLGMPVHLMKISNASAAIEGLRAGKVDVCSLGPFGYMIAHQKVGAEILVTGGIPGTGHTNYHSVVIVPADSPLRTMDDVKRSAKSLTLAWADAASTSGHLVPRAYFEKIGINPDTGFKQTFFSGTHLTTILNVKSGKVDLATVDENSLTSAMQKNRLSPGEVRVIWRSESMPSGGMVIRGGFEPEFREEVQQAFMSFCTEHPDLWGQWATAIRNPGAVWIPGDDAAYEGLRELARGVKHMRLLE